MKKIMLIMAAALTLAACHRQQAQEEQPPQEPAQEQETVEDQPADENAYINITGVTPDGQELSLSAVVGKTDYVLLDFWASWCGPCRRFIPVLKEMYASQPAGRLQILSCSVDEDAMAWRVALVVASTSCAHEHRLDKVRTVANTTAFILSSFIFRLQRYCD